MSNYRYATGGQAYTCLDCGALVEEEARDLHWRWHAEVVALMDDVDEMARDDHIIWLAKPDHSAVGGKPEGPI